MYVRTDLEDDMSSVGPMLFKMLGEKLLAGAADGLVREICRYFDLQMPGDLREKKLRLKKLGIGQYYVIVVPSYYVYCSMMY